MQTWNTDRFWTYSCIDIRWYIILMLIFASSFDIVIGCHGNCNVAMVNWHIFLFQWQWAVNRRNIRNKSTTWRLMLRYPATYCIMSSINEYLFEKVAFSGIHIPCLSPWQQMVVMAIIICITQFQWKTSTVWYYVVKWQY